MKKILEGIVVLDLTRFFSGPQCTLFLAGLGAEVIKIDDPGTGDPTALAPPFAGPNGIAFERKAEEDLGLAYLKRARGKKSATLNLKSPEGRELFLKLVASADVVVENFSTGVATRLGIDYPSLQAINPRIIYCSLTGYGKSGPDHEEKAYDLMIQSAVGLVGLTGHAGGPPVKAATPISDAIAGTFAATGILAALLHRERTGVGQEVDVSMADCLFALMFDEPIDCYARLGLQERQGNRIMRFSPFNVYQARDGWVAIGAATSRDWEALLKLMGRDELLDSAEYMNVSWRLENNEVVDSIVHDWTKQHARDHLVSVLSSAKIACSAVRSIEEVMNWRQLREREMIVPLVNPKMGRAVEASGPGFPIKFSASPAGYAMPAPLPGQHNEEILTGRAGLAGEDIARLRTRGIV